MARVETLPMGRSAIYLKNAPPLHHYVLEVTGSTIRIAVPDNVAKNTPHWPEALKVNCAPCTYNKATHEWTVKREKFAKAQQILWTLFPQQQLTEDTWSPLVRDAETQTLTLQVSSFGCPSCSVEGLKFQCVTCDFHLEMKGTRPLVVVEDCISKRRTLRQA